ncbi:MAG: MFS transporter [Pseudomonadota bacterium]
MKIFNGWRIVGGAAVMQFLQSCLVMHGMGAYVAALSQERGWSKTALSGGAALQSIEGALLGPLQGWLIDRFGARRSVQAGVLFLSAGLIVLSQIETLGGFYAAFVLIAIGTALSGYFPFTITIMHWFRRKRARALSRSALGLALGGLAVPAVAWTMQTWGWRSTALGSGILVLLIGLPIARLLHRSPSDIGEVEDGEPVDPDSPKPPSLAPVPAGPKFTARQALRTRAFWLLGVGHGFALLSVTAINVHGISHMKEGLGYSLAQAASVISLMTVCQVGGVLGGSAMGDRFDKRVVSAGCMLGHGCGMLLLTYAQNPLWLVGFAVLHGTAWGLRGPFMGSLRADYFGLESIGMIMGLSAIIVAAGQVGGPIVAGGLRDLTGDYKLGFTALALVVLFGSALFMLASKPATPSQA